MTRPLDVLVRAVPEGGRRALLGLSNTRFVHGRPIPIDVRVPAPIAARFDRPADGRAVGECVEATANYARYCEGNRPSFYFVARARKAERVLRLERGLIDRPTPDPGATLEALTSGPTIVRANAVTKERFTLEGEALFANTAKALAFDDLAAADANGDGVLDWGELAQTTDPEHVAPPPPEPDAAPRPGDVRLPRVEDAPAAPDGSMVATLERRAASFFVRR